MTTEEKAKAYDEALEYAKKLLKTIGNATLGNLVLKNEFERIFPELKESEDERIRKEIIDYFQSDWAKEEGITRPDWIAWLKRIGKQKPADKVEPKFHVGEWVFIEEIKGFKNGPFQIKTVNSLGYSFDEYHIIPLMYEELLSKWTIQDAKDGDMIYVSTEVKGIQAIFYKYEGGIIYFHCNLCGDFIADGYMPIGTIEFVSPLQKVHYQRFFQKMKEAGYEWDANHKQLKKIEQKPAWSEEDELIVAKILCICNDFERSFECSPLSTKVIKEDVDKIDNWLKSIKDRCTWKPSEEQLRELENVFSPDTASWDDNVLRKLHEQLKQL